MATVIWRAREELNLNEVGFFFRLHFSPHFLTANRLILTLTKINYSPKNAKLIFLQGKFSFPMVY